MLDFTEKVKELLEPILLYEGIELVEIEVKKQKTGHLLKIFIDKEGGVKLDDCENVSEQLSRILDVEDIFQWKYVLEVSSPGIDRPLKTQKDFKRCMEKLVNVSIKENEKISRVVGKVVDVTDSSVVLETEKKRESLEISFEKILKASIEIRF
ncbi:MAG: hypothetical protein A3C43_02730 [Candidatus Schekmanbacteria bacterium RIFCSPHIGHO2_02_FULL_38_11]|uniref:Ribosome maturation factor RimP n=1 Tax=Candidatus Schekmanbacteria bacterium RIFCSPLOWO2_12_FULL_38_15 TaxID=1817883 RepID=A0A1F7SI66_9BACT|nr:MAG: hypothetical protein A2043_06320 [Candidatus Schekmanbacteria bacterium GWA2_38_9]OGL50754.1 MAG: hypothetical protein A3H37_02775 [Candidatus Schekmanbacteria bacterium RIFCSPLOWO2_02_FULL_38_14]OGL53486.1 MAG: hypothetical protein A3G31_08290 [Candidatus Schekmanbacteria bacterium RIFCSPLOWO2_12_FULL_38_15]OGL54981.1 MAG: hypothetical protein A3C43_02730 [Candidatus Schekmanbacteria bacterium RIFCSPHIGHO2_02_FULL_38_11]